MAGYNKVILVGNLTRDPQLTHTPSGTPVCEIGMAVNNTWKDRDGNKREEVCFVDCSLYGRGAEVFNQYMAKGRSVLVEGRLRYDQWTTPEGQKRSRHRVFVENFHFLGGQRGPESGDGGGGGYSSGYRQSAAGGAGTPAAPARGYQSYGPPGGGAPVEVPAGAPEGPPEPPPDYDSPPPPSDKDVPF